MQTYICEKPSQARDIAAILGAVQRQDGFLKGSGAVVTWCFGHLLELAAPGDYGPQWKSWSMESLPIIPGTWKYNVPKHTKKQVGVIKKLLADASEVVIATDADREGELIARELLVKYKYKGKLKRLWLSALDAASIKKALSQMLDGDKTRPLYEAALARSHADWLIGMNLTRAYTQIGRAVGLTGSDKTRGVIAVGRVMTPTLRMVCERDEAITNFVVRPYYEVHASASAGGGSPDAVFPVKWIPAPEHGDKNFDESDRCLDRETAERVRAAVVGPGTARAVKIEHKQERPPQPFSLSALQQRASARFSLSAKNTLQTAQDLYEKHKITTYPRSDCGFLPMSMHAEAGAVFAALEKGDPSIADQLAGADLSLKGRVFNDKKITAHHAIIPTRKAPDMDALAPNERKLYEMIRRRYIAQFYPNREYTAGRIDCEFAGNAFSGTSQRTAAAGFRVLWPPEKKKDPAEAGVDFSSVKKGDSLVCHKAAVKDCETSPPKRYSEGGLIALMKKTGLGTEATRADTIEKLKRLEFVKLDKKNIRSTDYGRRVMGILPPRVSDPETTARWEDQREHLNRKLRFGDLFLLE